MVLLNVPGIWCTLEIDIQIADNLGLKLIIYQCHVLVNCLFIGQVTLPLLLWKHVAYKQTVSIWVYTVQAMIVCITLIQHI